MTASSASLPRTGPRAATSLRGAASQVLQHLVTRLAGGAPRSGPLADRQAARHAQVLSDSARIGVWRLPDGSRLLDLSPMAQDLLALPTPRPTEAEAMAPLPAEARERLRALHRQVRLTLLPGKVEAAISHPRLGLRHLRWSLDAETDRAGRFACVVGTVQDITDWQIDAERRRQAARMDALGQLAAGLAHDFNNLLCGLQLNLDLLAGAEPGAPTRAGLLDRARAAADRGAELTAQLLAFAGKHPAQRQPLCLMQSAREAATAAAPPRGVSIDLAAAEPGTPPLIIEADPMLLRTALHTLFGHAVQVSPDDSVVRVSFAARSLDATTAGTLSLLAGRYACLTVADQGEALTAELLPRVFEPFFRLRPNPEDGGMGGVGMAVVHGFARGHGGAVNLERRPGGGSLLRLLLPLAPEPVARAWLEQSRARVALDASPTRRAPLAGLRVLLVEDDAEVRETTDMLLREDGCFVTTAIDAAAAIAWLDSGEPFDLLLTDVVLPGGLSGLDVVESAAALRPGLPALLASGYAAPAQDLGRPLPAGVILLRKPYRHTDLMDAIAGTLAFARERAVA